MTQPRSLFTITISVLVYRRIQNYGSEVKEYCRGLSRANRIGRLNNRHGLTVPPFNGGVATTHSSRTSRLTRSEFERVEKLPLFSFREKTLSLDLRSTSTVLETSVAKKVPQQQ